MTIEYKRLVKKYIQPKKPELLSEEDALNEENFEFTKALINELTKLTKEIKKKTWGFNQIVKIRDKFKALKAETQKKST